MIWIHILAFTALFSVALFIMWLKNLKQKRFQEIGECIEGRILVRDNNANFAGLSSLGGKQIRGNGILILTEKELCFLMWLPRRLITIPVKNIVSADLTKTHAGRWTAYPMFHIIWQNDSGSDGVAFSTSRKELFLSEIKKLI